MITCDSANDTSMLDLNPDHFFGTSVAFVKLNTSPRLVLISFLLCCSRISTIRIFFRAIRALIVEVQRRMRYVCSFLQSNLSQSDIFVRWIAPSLRMI